MERLAKNVYFWMVALVNEVIRVTTVYDIIQIEASRPILLLHKNIGKL